MDQACLLALGANLPGGGGDAPQKPPQTPAQTLCAALRDLGAAPGVSLTAISPFYHTPCFPAGAGPDYVNAAAALTTSLSPRALLDLLHRIEADHGRARLQRWAGRTLDLDLLSMGDTVLPDAETLAAWIDLPAEDQINHTPDQLILPHPRIQDRAFVLVPLADVAPDWRHPHLGQTVVEMLQNLPDSALAEVKQLENTAKCPE
ncbi:MAG: 2-amino-4-hydroxy-6-hydroxymethyldihydropteridine diphosphokinase [Rhodobacterales bacterium]|nr:MAG: 2-amino-4-hydroxy-6-hydroxymethyldihydropteridine diphosphokinase [Rhodobacterales bacterium]